MCVRLRLILVSLYFDHVLADRYRIESSMCKSGGAVFL